MKRKHSSDHAQRLESQFLKRYNSKRPIEGKIFRPTILACFRSTIRHYM